MSLDFGKGNRSIAFNPTSAFPLDARCYFEDVTGKTGLQAAQEAAEGAKEVGSTASSYYYGMKLLVKEDDKYNWYVIGQDATGKGTLILENSGGEDGLSAYEIAIENGFEGTEEEWLASLKGEPGKDGKQGPAGESGVYILSEGETLESVPEDATVVVDPNGGDDWNDILEAVIASLPVYNGEVIDYEP